MNATHLSKIIIKQNYNNIKNLNTLYINENLEKLILSPLFYGFRIKIPQYYLYIVVKMRGLDIQISIEDKDSKLYKINYLEYQCGYKIIMIGLNWFSNINLITQEIKNLIQYFNQLERKYECN